MWPDRVSNPGPLTYKSGALPTALCGPATYPRTRGQSLRLFKDRARTELRRSVFRFRVVGTWNSITEEVVTDPIFDSFKAPRLNNIRSSHLHKFCASCYN